MDTPSATLTETAGPLAADSDPFDLDISFIESSPVIPELLRSTSDRSAGRPGNRSLSAGNLELRHAHASRPPRPTSAASCPSSASATAPRP